MEPLLFRSTRVGTGKTELRLSHPLGIYSLGEETEILYKKNEKCIKEKIVR